MFSVLEYLFWDLVHFLPCLSLVHLEIQYMNMTYKLRSDPHQG